MVAGVCAGVARHLNTDPVVVRVVFAALTFVGLAGLIVYVAAWLLIPEEGDDEGMLDAHLPGSMDREQVRRLGLFIAVAIAAASILGSGFTIDWPAIPLTLVALGVFYVAIIRPYNRRHAEQASAQSTTSHDAATDGERTDEPGEVTFTPAPHPAGSAPPLRDKPAGGRPRNLRRDRGALFGLTVAFGVLVVGAMGVYAATVEDIAWPYFPLAAFLVTGAGMLVGGVLGNGRPIALLAFPLGLVLLATTVLPTYTIGDDRTYPAYARDVDSSYQQGIGNFVLDLTEIRDPGSLDGRSIDIEQGVGSLEVIVPDGVDVDVDAHTDAGNLILLGKNSNGAPVSRHYVDPPSDDPQLHLDITQTTGEIRVTR